MALEDTLADLIQHLKASIKNLNDDAVAKELQAVLHDSRQLPDKKIAHLAAEAVDILGDIDLLLEPGHVILADHFLGGCSLCVSIISLDLVRILILSHFPRLYEHRMSCSGCRACNSRHPGQWPWAEQLPPETR